MWGFSSRSSIFKSTKPSVFTPCIKAIKVAQFAEKGLFLSKLHTLRCIKDICMRMASKYCT